MELLTSGHPDEADWAETKNETADTGGGSKRTRIEGDCQRIVAADGIVTPAPGLRAPDTPGLLSTFAPMTPTLPSSPIKPAGKRSLEQEAEGEERMSKKVDASTSPRKGHEKRVIDDDENVENKEKKMKTTDVALPSAATPEARPVEASPRGPPTAQLYPPRYAGEEAIEVHGDVRLKRSSTTTEVMKMMILLK